MLLVCIGLVFAASFSSHTEPAEGAPFLFKTNQDTFVPDDTLVAYGKGYINDTLVVRLFDPSGNLLRTDFIKLDQTGVFTEQVFTWPQASKIWPYGIYSLQINSSLGGKNTQQFPLVFTDSINRSGAPTVNHILTAKLDAPRQVSTNSTFRVFVQVTFDSALVDANATQLLGSSHIHSATFANQTLNIGNSFNELHQGLYYADVTLVRQGTYIIHVIAYYNGYFSHDSLVITASNSTIGSVQQSVDELNSRLDVTNTDLSNLQRQLDTTNRILNSTGASISTSVVDARKNITTDIATLQAASGQLNSIILPILALISIVIALQISLFARIRASYK